MTAPPRKSRAGSESALSVAFVTSLPRWGGGEKWFLEAAAAFHARGYRVCVVGQPGAEIVERATARSLRSIALPMHGILDPRTLLAMGRLLRRERVDVAIVNQAREIRLVGLSQLGRRGFKMIARRGSPDPIKDAWHFRWVYGRWVDALILNAHALVEKVCGGAPWFDRKKIRVIPNGIDVDAYRADASAERGRAALLLDADARLVSMVGEVGWRKDQRTFLKAIARHRNRFPDDGTVFAIVGEGEDRLRLEADAREMGLTDSCLRWLGFRRDVADLLAASDLVVLPSREEGFPNTLLEAMALGRCVLATPVDGIPELVIDGETGVLLPVGDPVALADSMRELLEDPDRRERYGAAAARRARAEFDQTSVMDRVEAVVTSLTN